MLHCCDLYGCAISVVCEVLKSFLIFALTVHLQAPPRFWLSLFVSETTFSVFCCHHICLLRVFHIFDLSKSRYLSPCYHF